MEQMYKSHDEAISKLREDSSANKTEHDSFRRRLHEHDEKIEQMSALMLAIQKQGDAIECMTKTLNDVKTSVDKVETSVDKVEKRVADIEREPADRWKKIVFEVIKYVVIAVVGVVVGHFIKT